jgi:hypothetical protein
LTWPLVPPPLQGAAPQGLIPVALGPDEIEEVRFQAARLAHLWGRAAAEGLEAPLAGARAEYWAWRLERGRHTLREFTDLRHGFQVGAGGGRRAQGAGSSRAPGCGSAPQARRFRQQAPGLLAWHRHPLRPDPCRASRLLMTASHLEPTLPQELRLRGVEQRLWELWRHHGGAGPDGSGADANGSGGAEALALPASLLLAPTSLAVPAVLRTA